MNFSDFTRFADLGANSPSNAALGFGSFGALVATRRRITAISCSTGYAAKCCTVNTAKSVAWGLL